jgi:ferredoxin
MDLCTGCGVCVENCPVMYETAEGGPTGSPGGSQ